MKTPLKNMKILFRMMLLASVCLQLACQDEDQTSDADVVPVRFSFASVADAGQEGGRTAAIPDLPEGSSLRISIARSTGEVVFTLKPVSLYRMSGGYVSEPLILQRGTYNVTDYMVIGPGNQILYAAPRSGSPLAGYVADALPIAFNVNSGAVVNNVEVEVIDASVAAPEEFGYTSFPLDVKSINGFTISVFKPETTGYTFTAARLILLHGADTIAEKMLTPKINTVLLDTYDHDTVRYTVVVIRDGFDRFEKKLSRGQLMLFAPGQPLTVVLNPALTLRVKTDYMNMYSRYYLTGKEGTVIQVNWGDGTIEHHTLHAENNYSHAIEHAYVQNKSYFVSITQNLADIKGIVSTYNNNVIIDTISVSNLPGLERFVLSSSRYQSRGVDFSKNPNLKELTLFNFSSAQTLDISANTHLEKLYLPATNFSSSVLNKIVSDWYSSVIQHPRRGDAIFYSSSGPLSPMTQANLDKLWSLVHDHHWTVYWPPYFD
jgi:hypothetical protein